MESDWQWFLQKTDRFIKMKNKYYNWFYEALTLQNRIRRRSVFFPNLLVNLRKSWSLGHSFNKILIENFSFRNYFKINLLNFSFLVVPYCNNQTILQLLFFYFFINSICKLSIKLAWAISSSSTYDHPNSIAFSLFSRPAFCSVNSISIGSLSSYPPIMAILCN